MDCEYCGCDATAHDPVYVAEGADRDGVGWFCNYACLVQYVEREGLQDGATCQLS